MNDHSQAADSFDIAAPFSSHSAEPPRVPPAPRPVADLPPPFSVGASAPEPHAVAPPWQPSAITASAAPAPAVPPLPAEEDLMPWELADLGSTDVGASGPPFPASDAPSRDEEIGLPPAEEEPLPWLIPDGVPAPRSAASAPNEPLAEPGLAPFPDWMDAPAPVYEDFADEHRSGNDIAAEGVSAADREAVSSDVSPQFRWSPHTQEDAPEERSSAGEPELHAAAAETVQYHGDPPLASASNPWNSSADDEDLLPAAFADAELHTPETAPSEVEETVPEAESPALNREAVSPVADFAAQTPASGEGQLGIVLGEVAERLERIAASLRGRSPEEVMRGWSASPATDPLELLVTGFVMGAAHRPSATSGEHG